MAKTKKWTEKYEELDILGEGGNAVVYLVREKNTSDEYALKELQNRTEEKKKRFLNEIQIEIENAELIIGMVPVIDFNKEQYWYTMPIAIPVMSIIKEKNIFEIVNGVIQLSETLEQLHNKKIYHRDIKPSNIYFYKNRLCFGDFGLVDFPESEELTQSDKGLGAVFTIAPEMKRNPKHADAGKADVFSLAKTLWMFLCGDEKGFDGVYNYLDPSHSLRYMSQYANEHLVEIDELLKEATDNIPEFRPDIHQFKIRLMKWQEIAYDIDKSQNSEWNFLKKQLFGMYVPTRASWEDVDSIINVLNIIGRIPAYNHMLLPDSGGLDFSHAEKAPEKDCIYLYDTIGCCFVVNPQILVYEGFGEDYRWNYFMLDLKKIEPIFERNTREISYEYLVEDVPAHYVDAKYAQYGVYDYDTGEVFPEGYKEVRRYINGKFLIVLKFGPYNHISGTYDSRHNLCSNNKFRTYIEELRHKYMEIYMVAKSDERFKDVDGYELERKILGLKLFDRNPFNKKPIKRISITKNEKMIEVKDFIKKHYKEWNFFEELGKDIDDEHSLIRFYIRFHLSGGEVFDLLDEKIKIIAKDGFIKEISLDSIEESYFVYERKAAILLLERLKHKFNKLICVAGFGQEEDFYQYFKVNIMRLNKPAHIFTKEEIKGIMRKADDRRNNKLIIDEAGYAKVIGDDIDGSLFPVSLESWNAGNNYVGKYSDLLTLDDNYIMCLQGWLEYLKTGKAVQMDYVENNREEEKLLIEIKEFYK